MPRVDFNIGNQHYDLACEEGQQGRIRMLAKNIDGRFRLVAQSLVGAPDSLILAVTALMMEDEMRGLKEQKGHLASQAQQNEALEHVIAEIIEPFSAQIEALAQRLEKL